MIDNKIPLRFSAVPGVLAVAAVYIYFLIFAQFAFLRLAQGGGVSSVQLRIVMACMGAAGVATSLWAGKHFQKKNARRILQWAFAGCAATAILAVFANGLFANCIIAAGIGAGVGTLTVTLAASLPQLLGINRLGLKTGFGTGIAYAVCNVPMVFGGTPAHQAYFAAAVCLLGIGTLFRSEFLSVDMEEKSLARSFPFAPLVVAFLALVWLDSAAFYILQETPTLNRFAWSGSSLQWQNAAIHLFSALLGGLWLDRDGLKKITLPAFLCLASAALCASSKNQNLAQATHWFYAAGVSLYSTALAFAPAGTSPGNSRRAALRAGALYALAGWVGSALGIGMAQNLHIIPNGFLGVAGAVVLLTWKVKFRLKEVAVSGVVVAMFYLSRNKTTLENVEPSPEFGREVYISEGCIHCHSQYVRPGTHDEEWWGPVHSSEDVLNELPPLIGNRRQGPDLQNVGNRRSPHWNRIHLIDPRALSPGSVMPSYAHLFRAGDERGPSLLLYLADLGGETFEQQARIRASWKPLAEPSVSAGKILFQKYCTQCHGPSGLGDGPLVKELNGWQPRNLSLGLWQHIPKTDTPLVELARVVKFGVAGTPMAGHEYWSDLEVLDVAAYVQSLSQKENRR